MKTPVEIVSEGGEITYHQGPPCYSQETFPYKEIKELARRLKTEKDLIIAISRLIRETETVNHWGA